MTEEGEAPQGGAPSGGSQPRRPDGKFAPKKQDTSDTSTEVDVDKLKQERDLMAKELSEIKQMLQQKEEKEQQLQLEKVRAEKLGELRSIDPRLAEKHKDTADVDKLDLLIDTAKSFKSNFAEYKKEDEGDKPQGPPLRRDLKSGDFV